MKKVLIIFLTLSILVACSKKQNEVLIEEELPESTMGFIAWDTSSPDFKKQIKRSTIVKITHKFIEAFTKRNFEATSWQPNYTQKDHNDTDNKDRVDKCTAIFNRFIFDTLSNFGIPAKESVSDLGQIAMHFNEKIGGYASLKNGQALHDKIRETVDNLNSALVQISELYEEKNEIQVKNSNFNEGKISGIRFGDNPFKTALGDYSAYANDEMFMNTSDYSAYVNNEMFMSTSDIEYAKIFFDKNNKNKLSNNSNYKNLVST